MPIMIGHELTDRFWVSAMSISLKVGELRARVRHGKRVLVKKIRRAPSTFAASLRSGNVVGYQWAYYIAIFMWGIYSIFFAAPNRVVEPVMGSVVYHAWVWSCIAAPLCAMFGLSYEKRGGSVGYFSLWGQLVGNISIGMVLFAYELAALIGTEWGRGSFTVFIVPPYMIGSFLLSTAAGLKLIDVERLKTAIEDDTKNVSVTEDGIIEITDL